MPTRFIWAATLCCLLAVAPSAFAECAWVLWTDEEMKLPEQAATVRWAAPIAFSDRAACVGWLDEQTKNWKTSAEFNQLASRAGGGTMAELRSHSKGGWNAVRLRCLPDTVDPRGPKAK